MGDVDGNGEVAIMDATLIQRYVAKYNDLTELQKLVGDVNKDDEISIFDATIIQRYLSKKIDTL